MPYITVFPSLTQPCVALVTSDPVVYAELVAGLRERGLPSVSLLPGDRIPPHAAVVLTTTREANRISHPCVLAVGDLSDRSALWAAVRHALARDAGGAPLVVGIDPGPRPGYALLSSDRVVSDGILDSPEAVGRFATELSARFAGRDVVYRVGSGDPPCRNRIVNALLTARRTVEVVNEGGTTPRGRRPRDALAAGRIGRSRGRAVFGRLPVPVTRGEVSNVQRLSREGSGGLVTISRQDASRVIRGELSLAEAVRHRLKSSAAVGTDLSRR